MRKHTFAALMAATVVIPSIASAQVRYYARGSLPLVAKTAPTGTKLANGNTVSCTSAGTPYVFYVGGAGLNSGSDPEPFQASQSLALQKCELLFKNAFQYHTGDLSTWKFVCNVGAFSNGAGGIKYQGGARIYQPGESPILYDDRATKANGNYSGDLCSVK